MSQEKQYFEGKDIDVWVAKKPDNLMFTLRIMNTEITIPHTIFLVLDHATTQVLKKLKAEDN